MLSVLLTSVAPSLYIKMSLVRFQKELTQKLNQTIFSKQISEENKILNDTVAMSFYLY